MEKVLFSGPAHCIPGILQVLGERFEIERVEPSPDLLWPKFKESTVFLDASMKVRIPKELIEASDHLRLVVTATTGADHIDQAALSSKEIPLLTLKGQTQVLHNITASAELSWLLLMACARQLRSAIHHVEKANWERTQFPGLMLNNRTLGIIGLGRNGTWMSRYGTAFGMKIKAFDPYVSDFPEGIKRTELEDLLASSDFISLHVNLTPETKGMLNKNLINKFKPGSVFINTSRGELTDEEAIVNALKNGRIAAAGIDVMVGEPDINRNPVWQYAQENNNVIITPHIGGFCPDAVETTVRFSCERILKFFGGAL